MRIWRVVSKMDVVTLGHEIAKQYDTLMLDGEYDAARDFLRENRKELNYLRFHYEAMRGITLIEEDMIREIEPGFVGRLERQLAMIAEVSSE